MKDYGREIASIALKIKAIKLQPNDPFTWASGYRMPIYNDNRLLLDNYEHRLLVAEGFKHIIEENDIQYDLIAGTPTAGIAPSASIANLLEVPLLIIEENNPYVFKQPFSVEEYGDFDGIACTCPWAIPFGVTLANEKKLPFMYVRQSKKSHGLKQQIEGIALEGQKILLIDYHRNVNYIDSAIKALKEKGIIIEKIISESVLNRAEQIDINQKKVIVIEDLISTGGSSANAVQAIRNVNGDVDYCISIFNYGFDKAVQAFDSLNPKCNVRSLLTYDFLLEVAKEIGYLTQAQVKLLEDWSFDPFNWGEKYGFPKTER